MGVFDKHLLVELLLLGDGVLDGLLLGLNVLLVLLLLGLNPARTRKCLLLLFAAYYSVSYSVPLDAA